MPTRNFPIPGTCGIWLVLVFVGVLSANGQTNPGVSPPNLAATPVLPAGAEIPDGLNDAIARRVEQARNECIQDRRRICGRILQIAPEGLVVESGYTNLLRAPLMRSWLVPGTVSASRAAGLIEGREPDAVCVGKVFLTDVPKSHRLKPKVADYVIIEGYPDGETDYVSLGTVRRTLRKFTTVLEKSVDRKLALEEPRAVVPTQGK